MHTPEHDQAATTPATNASYERPAGAALLASDPDSAAPLLARYRRGSGGKTVHRAECTTLRGRGTPWPYADGKTADQIVQAMASAPWLYACKVCRPDRDGEQA